MLEEGVELPWFKLFIGFLPKISGVIVAGDWLIIILLPSKSLALNFFVIIDCAFFASCKWKRGASCFFYLLIVVLRPSLCEKTTELESRFAVPCLGCIFGSFVFTWLFPFATWRLWKFKSSPLGFSAPPLALKFLVSVLARLWRVSLKPAETCGEVAKSLLRIEDEFSLLALWWPSNVLSLFSAGNILRATSFSSTWAFAYLSL